MCLYFSIVREFYINQVDSVLQDFLPNIINFQDDHEQCKAVNNSSCWGLQQSFFSCCNPGEPEPWKACPGSVHWTP